MTSNPASSNGWKPADESTPVAAPSAPAVAVPSGAAPVSALDLYKNTARKTLVNAAESRRLETFPADRQRAEIRDMIRKLFEAEPPPVPAAQYERVARELVDDMLGYGPLEPLLTDPGVTDILVNGPGEVFVERGGVLELTEVRFRDDEHVRQVIDRIVSRVGRRVDESSPMVDARLPDGSRVNAIVPPLSLRGPAVSIRRFNGSARTLEDLTRLGMLTPEIGVVLQAAVRARLNVVVSGGTGSGKTTLLNALSRFIPGTERIVTIEDSAELRLQQRHVLPLEARPPNLEGKGAVTVRDLVRNALRMRPDRIVVGECRGAEALDMLQAMNTGHDGSLTTLHANSPRDAVGRLETMVLMAGYDLPVRVIRQQIAAAVDLIVQTARLSGGSRKVTAVSELVGMEGDTIGLQDLFVYDQHGVGAQGRVAGAFRSTGVRPAFAERLASVGVPLPTDLFAERVLARDA